MAADGSPPLPLGLCQVQSHFLLRQPIDAYVLPLEDGNLGYLDGISLSAESPIERGLTGGGRGGERGAHENARYQGGGHLQNSTVHIRSEQISMGVKSETGSLDRINHAVKYVALTTGSKRLRTLSEEVAR